MTHAMWLVGLSLALAAPAAARPAKGEARRATAARPAAKLDAEIAALSSADLEAAAPVQIIGAMSAIGGGAARPALGSHLLPYHADDELGADPAWQTAIVLAIARRGGARGTRAVAAGRGGSTHQARARAHDP